MKLVARVMVAVVLLLGVVVAARAQQRPDAARMKQPLVGVALHE